MILSQRQWQRIYLQWGAAHLFAQGFRDLQRAAIAMQLSVQWADGKLEGTL